jgi:hypothetical protein
MNPGHQFISVLRYFLPYTFISLELRQLLRNSKKSTSEDVKLSYYFNAFDCTVQYSEV